MNRQKWMVVAAFSSLLGIALIVGCGTLADGNLFPGGGGLTIPRTPRFLIAVDSDAAGANVNVFPINATTGALGAAVAGSPFDRGLTNAMTIAVHPNGHWFYVADGNNGSIHMWDVNTTTGVPTEIAAPVLNGSGTFYQPSGSGDSPTHVITVTPDGRYLYAANDDATVSAYSVGSTGALTHISDLDVGAGRTGAITANNSFVWVTDTPESLDGECDAPDWHVMAMRIGSTGALTMVSTADLTGVFCWLWSIAVSPDGRFVQVGDEGGDAQVYSFTVGADGSLTQVSPQVVLNSSSDCRDIAFSPDSRFFYASDDTSAVHAVNQNADGSITEPVTSPYPTDDGDGQIIVDLTGRFVYVGSTFQVTSYTRDTTTGALTEIGVTDTANSDPIAVGIVRVSP